MSATVTESAPPAPSTEIAASSTDPPAAPTELSDQSKFLRHLASYPAVGALAGLIASFPIAKIFVSNAVPLLQYIHERTAPVTDAAKPLAIKLDQVGDDALSCIDSKLPGLKTLHPNDVYVGAQHCVDNARSNAASAYDERIAKPISNASRAVKDQYEHIYDSQVASRVAPLNDRLQTALDQYLPGPGEVSSEKGTGELSRLYKIAALTAERSVPKVRSVYEEKLGEQKTDSLEPGVVAKFLAILATGRLLTSEAYTAIINHFGGPQKLEEAVDEVRRGIEAHVEAKEAAVAEAIQNAQGVN